jgi:hypothetical protein
VISRYFYIVSYPRCRSTWLSHFLTTDISHCYHSQLSNYDAGGYRGLLNTQKQYVGSCDENPVSFLLSQKPNGPVVVVKRNMADCVESFEKAFDLPGDFPTEEMFYTYERALNTIAKKTESISVGFEDLSDTATIFRIWRHLLRDVPCELERVMRFQDTVIVVKNRDLGPALSLCAQNLRMSQKEYIEKLRTGEIFS